MLLIGGYHYRERERSHIWELNEVWTKVGDLKTNFKNGALLKVGTSIFVFPGEASNKNQRIDLNADEKIAAIEIIGEPLYPNTYPTYSGHPNKLPIIMQTSSNVCTE